MTVDPSLTVKQAHEVATEVESAIRENVGSETQSSCTSNRRTAAHGWTPFLAMTFS
jgi:divalent metal cation (Fe/Co/Zn/Cd) transporter